MNSIDVDLLRVFLVLMDELSVSRAAERCDMSQPTMSRALARLRTLLHDPLLTRAGGHMVPTSRALGLATQVRGLVEGLENLTRRPEAFDPATSDRTFVLTAPELGERMLMPGLLRRFRGEAPNARLEVRAPDPERAYALLESGEIDLRIAWLPRPAPSLRSMPLFQDELVCIAASDHPSVQGELTLEQFLSLPHARTLGITHATTSRSIDEAVERLGRRLERAFLVQNFLTVPSALAGTDVLATLPRSQALTFARQYPLQVLPPPLRLPRIRYAAYWHERSQADAGHRWFRRILNEARQAER